MDSLERIKEKQALADARMSAADEIQSELGEDSLQAKLEKAGIASSEPSADDVLARLREKAAKSAGAKRKR